MSRGRKGGVCGAKRKDKDGDHSSVKGGWKGCAAVKEQKEKQQQ